MVRVVHALHHAPQPTVRGEDEVARVSTKLHSSSTRSYSIGSGSSRARASVACQTSSIIAHGSLVDDASPKTTGRHAASESGQQPK